MTNHNNTVTFCEIRNSVKILLGLVSHIIKHISMFYLEVSMYIIYENGSFLGAANILLAYCDTAQYGIF